MQIDLASPLARDVTRSSKPRQSQTELLRSIAGKRALHVIFRKVAPIQFSRNAGIYREGDPVGPLYRVISGAVRTCKVLADGRRQIGAFYLPGETFGLETQADHLFSAEAVIDSKVLIVKSQSSHFEHWDLQEASETWELMRRDLMRRELQLAQSHFLLLIKTAPERVASFLLEMAERIQSGNEVEVPMSRRDIADYLGLTTETVSRTLTQLEREAAIAIPGSKCIVLRKRAALRRLAEVGPLN
jgi:CRP/FNR family nitrogen fixation transcriptional regulator